MGAPGGGLSRDAAVEHTGIGSAAGQGAFRTCERHIQAVFDAAIRNKSDKDRRQRRPLAGWAPARDRRRRGRPRHAAGPAAPEVGRREDGRG
ncbi:unnamed protein product, partial [Prorocentrum cordatum]